MKTKIEIGQKYNRLTVLEKLGYDKHNNRMYRCLCDCGNEIVLRGTALTSGNTKSCGCLSKEVKQSKRLPNNKGIINQIILQYKRHARDRNLSWNLTYEQVEKIIQEPCFYCGTEKSNHKVTKNCKEGYDHLSVRSYNVLHRAGCRTLGDVIKVVESGEMLNIRNMGRKSAEEILDKIYRLTGKRYTLTGEEIG